MMDHKAYLFDFKGFRDELAVKLQIALSMKKADGLLSFIVENVGWVKSPYTGKVLDFAG